MNKLDLLIKTLFFIINNINDLLKYFDSETSKIILGFIENIIDLLYHNNYDFKTLQKLEIFERQLYKKAYPQVKIPSLKYLATNTLARNKFEMINQEAFNYYNDSITSLNKVPEVTKKAKLILSNFILFDKKKHEKNEEMELPKKRLK